MPSIGSWYAIIHLSIIHVIYNTPSLKVTFLTTQSLLLPEFSTYRHRTGFIVKRKQVRITNYLGLPINWIFFLNFKADYFGKKNMGFSKNSPQFFFLKEIIGQTYICTKCNDNFKFSSNFQIFIKSHDNYHKYR